jgi:hypothetical protein
MSTPTFVQLIGYVDGFVAQPVWVNPERVAYLQPRHTYRNRSRPSDPVGTRIFFAEDGTLDVAELPDVVLDLFAGSPFVCPNCHDRRDAPDIANDICPTCETARADAAPSLKDLSLGTAPPDDPAYLLGNVVSVGLPEKGQNR